MKKLIMLLGVAAVAAGCTSVYKNDGGEADLCPTIVRDIAYEKYDIKSTPVESFDKRLWVLGMDFGAKPDHYADNAPGGFFAGHWIDRAKNAAFANACAKAECDTLVGARYYLKFKECLLWQEAEVKVVGYPAKLTGVEFRKANFDCSCGKK